MQPVQRLHALRRRSTGAAATRTVPPHPQGNDAGPGEVKGSAGTGPLVGVGWQRAAKGTKPFCECHPGDRSCTSAAAAGGAGSPGRTVPFCGTSLSGGNRREMPETLRSPPGAQPTHGTGTRGEPVRCGSLCR